MTDGMNDERSGHVEAMREHRRRRFRRHGKRAYIRSVYSLPSLATLGNLVCGFGAMYVAGLDLTPRSQIDQLTQYFAEHPFTVAAFLIFVAMAFDAIDGRLARFTRHTTDFGGQLDSLADVISFGAAPAFLALQLVRSSIGDVPVAISRGIWAAGALYVSCAAIRLARFNVSNQHGEQHHYSFLGLPSPGAGATVAAFVIMQQEIAATAVAKGYMVLEWLAQACVWMLPVIVMVTGLLMVSTFRYPHMVNRYLRGKRSVGRVIGSLALGLVAVVFYKYALAVGTLMYSLWGPALWAQARFWPKAAAEVSPLPQTPGST